jgi:CBS domain containing-hemolysin-like protein
VASEFAMARMRLTEATEIERGGLPGASSARRAVEHIDAYLAACQLGITLASIGLGVIGKPAFEALLHPHLCGRRKHRRVRGGRHARLPDHHPAARGGR